VPFPRGGGQFVGVGAEVVPLRLGARRYFLESGYIFLRIISLLKIILKR